VLPTQGTQSGTRFCSRFTHSRHLAHVFFSWCKLENRAHRSPLHRASPPKLVNDKQLLRTYDACRQCHFPPKFRSMSFFCRQTMTTCVYSEMQVSVLSFCGTEHLPRQPVVSNSARIQSKRRQSYLFLQDSTPAGSVNEA
jgi:hypothetical protein